MEMRTPPELEDAALLAGTDGSSSARVMEMRTPPESEDAAALLAGRDGSSSARVMEMRTPPAFTLGRLARLHTPTQLINGSAYRPLSALKM